MRDSNTQAPRRCICGDGGPAARSGCAHTGTGTRSQAPAP
jgi:hypothetical protein